MLIVVTSIAQISSVCSLFPICILRHCRRFGSPWLRAFHSPSPAAFKRLLPINRCNGPVEPLYGVATDSVFLSPTQGAEVQPYKFQQTVHAASCLPQRQAEQNFERQAGLHRRTSVGLLVSSSTRRRSLPYYLRIKLDRQ